MPDRYAPPGFLTDFDRAADPESHYAAWDAWMAATMQASGDYPAWYEALNPPANDPPDEAAPPWQGLPRTALVMHDKDVLAAALAVDKPVEFGSGRDGIGDRQPPFLRADGSKLPGQCYRPQDEYLEWVTVYDSDQVVREVWFTCEGPEYWERLASDQELLIALYAELLGVTDADIDPAKLYFEEDVSQANIYSPGGPVYYNRGDYNPYNEYNRRAAVHLTQGANTLGAEIFLAMQGSRIYGDPPKTSDPELVCCAAYGGVNRASDPTIGKMVNDLARQGNFVTLRNPVGLYMNEIRENDFTDANGERVAVADGYFVPTRMSPDGDLILRARFAVPDGVTTPDGRQARVGDLRYMGVPIQSGGQIADAITMNLFAQALPGAPTQEPVSCIAHPCPDPDHPDYVIPVPVGTPCSGVPSLAAARALSVSPVAPPRPGLRSRVALWHA